MALRCVVFFLVGAVAFLPFVVGLAVGLVLAGFFRGIKFARELCRACWETLFSPPYKSALLLLLIPTALLRGCGDDDKSWYAELPSVVHQSNGFSFRVHGPRDTGYAPDAFPSLEAGLVTVDEIGKALELEARDLAGRTGLDEEAAVAELRALEVVVVDDYAFDVQGRWAAGMYTGRVYVCLWLRALSSTSEAIPLSSPGWTIRAPEGGEPWRYGARPLVPAADHELGHHFFGPGFEH